MMGWAERARELDQDPDWRALRDEFYRPAGGIYLDGNSLGLPSRAAEASVLDVLEQWKRLAIGGWLEAQPPWFELAERLGNELAPLVGAKPGEVVVANSTTVNLHQLLATFYEPPSSRPGILVDCLAFPTDVYAVDSHLRLRGQPASCRKLVPSRDGYTLDEEDIIAALDADVQLAILPSVIYTSGQLLDLARLTHEAHRRHILIGFDCSHSVGVIPHEFTAWDVDFAFFCTYKYLNGGPGAPAALYLNERHAERRPGLAGWFGGRKDQQFEMRHDFVPAVGAGGLQLGTPHVLSLAPLLGSLSLIRRVGVPALRARSLELTGFLREALAASMPAQACCFADPADEARRGGHVAWRHPHAAALSRQLRKRGCVVDHRPPDIVRLAPSPLYTSFSDCWQAAQLLGELVRQEMFWDEPAADSLDLIP